MDALDKDIKENGCHQCENEMKKHSRFAVYDEGIDKRFCSIKCQLAFYQSEYDRLITKCNGKVLYTLPKREYRVLLEEYRWYISVAFMVNNDNAIETDVLSGETEEEVTKNLVKMLKNMQDRG